MILFFAYHISIEFRRYDFYLKCKMTRNAPIRKSIIFLSIENKNVKNVVYGLKVKFVKTNNQLKSRKVCLIHFYIYLV